jgi:hypothetical protein
MQIEELISGKGDDATIEVEGISIPASTLKHLMQEGYVHLKPEGKSKAVTLWGKTCCACLTEEQLRERG